MEVTRHLNVRREECETKECNVAFFKELLVIMSMAKGK